MSIQPTGALILAQLKLSVTTCDLKMGWIQKKYNLKPPKSCCMLVLMSFLHNIFSRKKGRKHARDEPLCQVEQDFVHDPHILLGNPHQPPIYPPRIPRFFLFPYIPNMQPPSAGSTFSPIGAQPGYRLRLKGRTGWKEPGLMIRPYLRE